MDAGASGARKVPDIPAASRAAPKGECVDPERRLSGPRRAERVLSGERGAGAAVLDSLGLLARAATGSRLSWELGAEGPARGRGQRGGPGIGRVVWYATQ